MTFVRQTVVTSVSRRRWNSHSLFMNATGSRWTTVTAHSLNATASTQLSRASHTVKTALFLAVSQFKVKRTFFSGRQPLFKYYAIVTWRRGFTYYLPKNSKGFFSQAMCPANWRSSWCNTPGKAFHTGKKKCGATMSRSQNLRYYIIGIRTEGVLGARAPPPPGFIGGGAQGSTQTSWCSPKFGPGLR